MATLAEPPEGAYLQSEILTHTKEDFYKQIWTLKYRSWTVTVRDGTVHAEDFLAYCFYTPSKEGRVARVVLLDAEDKSFNEMFKYFEWWIFSFESKLIEVEVNEEPKEKQPAKKVKKLHGKRIARAVG